MLPGLGVAATSYQIIFDSDATDYRIEYNSSAGSGTLETVTLPQNVKVKQVYIGAVSHAQITVSFTSPFGEIGVIPGGNGAEIELELEHISNAQTKSVIIDRVTGRISRK